MCKCLLSVSDSVFSIFINKLKFPTVAVLCYFNYMVAGCYMRVILLDIHSSMFFYPKVAETSPYNSL